MYSGTAAILCCHHPLTDSWHLLWTMSRLISFAPSRGRHQQLFCTDVKPRATSVDVRLHWNRLQEFNVGVHSSTTITIMLNKCMLSQESLPVPVARSRLHPNHDTISLLVSEGWHMHEGMLNILDPDAPWPPTSATDI